ncbi:MAG: cell division FtsA domain-containing protein [Deltaproteobacteria bacterium]|nr:cell division FtsA domain-containing protein [Deltaproteobacteria bacterium]
MFSLVRALVSVALLGGLVYVAVAVPMGGKTIWQHVKAIADSKEGQELADGVKEKAGEVLRRDGGPESDARDGGGRRARKPSREKLTDKERELLRKLIREKLEDDKSK